MTRAPSGGRAIHQARLAAPIDIRRRPHGRLRDVPAEGQRPSIRSTRANPAACCMRSDRSRRSTPTTSNQPTGVSPTVRGRGRSFRGRRGGRGGQSRAARRGSSYLGRKCRRRRWDPPHPSDSHVTLVPAHSPTAPMTLRMPGSAIEARPRFVPRPRTRGHLAGIGHPMVPMVIGKLPYGLSS